MKRIIIIIAFMLCICGLRAQYSDLYYHRVGDTIEQNPNNGYFEWWGWDESLETNQLVDYWESFTSMITLQQYYTPVPLRVLGLAAIIRAKDFSYASRSWCQQTSYQEYLYLYEADPSGFHKVAESPYHLTDTHRTLHITFNIPDHSVAVNDCCLENLTEMYKPLYEYYFDNAITVYDSFYVGASNFSGESFSRYRPFYARVMYDGTATTNCKGQYQDVVGCPGAPGTVLRAYIAPGTGDTLWMWQSSPFAYHLLVYPIVEVDTTLPPADMCVDVGGVRGSLSGDCLTVSWDAWPRYTNLQLRYGPETMPESEWDTLTVTGASHTICAVDTTVSHYGVSLRAYCISAHDTTDWSPVEWIPMVQNTGITVPDAEETLLAASVFLSPNPAAGSVHVGSRHMLTRIEMVNARGILVYSEPAHGHEATIDLDRLPAGLYLVTAQTINGTVAKRLVVR